MTDNKREYCERPAQDSGQELSGFADLCNYPSLGPELCLFLYAAKLQKMDFGGGGGSQKRRHPPRLPGLRKTPSTPGPSMDFKTPTPTPYVKPLNIYLGLFAIGFVC